MLRLKRWKSESEETNSSFKTVKWRVSKDEMMYLSEKRNDEYEMMKWWMPKRWNGEFQKMKYWIAKKQNDEFQKIKC